MSRLILTFITATLSYFFSGHNFSVNGLTRSYDFLKIWYKNSPSVHTVYSDIGDELRCASACTTATVSTCKAFKVYDDRCYLFSGIAEEETDASKYEQDKIAFLVKFPTLPKCTSIPGFQVLTTSKGSRCLKPVSRPTPLDQARKACHNLGVGAQMAFVVTHEEGLAYVALPAIRTISEILINVKYDSSSDSYPGERPGDVLEVRDPNWGPWEPSDRPRSACVQIRHTGLFNDVNCREGFPSLCEVFATDYELK